MRRTKKFLLISILGAGLAILFLLAAAVTTHLLANRDLVKSYIVNKTAQATGGDLDYKRIEINFLPLPHLAVQDVHLALPETFALRANELSVYPRILAMLSGRISIRRLALNTPDFRVYVPHDTKRRPQAPKMDEAGLGAAIDSQIKSMFSVLAAIDPETQVEIDHGRVAFVFSGQPDIQIHTIRANAERTSHMLSLDLSCSSSVIKKIKIQATVDIIRSQAKGSISLTDIDPHLILSHVSLPAGISMSSTQASANLDFTINGTAKTNSRFHLEVPTLVIKRNDRALKLSAATLSGEIGYEKRQLSLRLDTIAIQQPALNLSADAILVHNENTGTANLRLSAAAEQLDVALAADVSRAIAGDQDSIRTAFDVARAGTLAGPVYSAVFNYDQTGWHLGKMKASGRLSQGLVSISDIDADVENVAGEIVYEDHHVDFLNLSGRFEGATFNHLDVTMDWANQATWAVRSSSVEVDAAPFFNWLTGFEALAGIRQTISIISGRAVVPKLGISGPLTEPGKWDLDIIVSPQDLVLKTPQTPFDIKLSGGNVVYRPSKEESSNVGIQFLDASFVASHQSSGIVDPQTLNLQIDGSMGPEAVAWLGTLTTIPDHLQINPPVTITSVKLAWNQPATLSLTGELKTAGETALFFDFTHSPEELEIRKLQFTDKFSKATISARKGQDTSIELAFSGNVSKQTADHLFKTNQILSGNIEGDFKALFRMDTPLDSKFLGQLKGNGLQLLDLTSVPITLDHFSIVGRGNQIEVLSSEIMLDDMALRMGGKLFTQERALIFDIDVESDRLNEGLIQALKSEEKASPAADAEKAPQTVALRGTIHFKTQSLTYGGFTWSPVNADIRIEPDETHITINQAQLCGISTTGEADITPQGFGFNISPLARNASFQQTYDCLWDKYVRVDAHYDLEGNVLLHPTQKDPLTSLSGGITFSTQNGRIYHSSTLLKIFSMLNITELFTGGKSDLAEEGYGYSKAWAKARLEDGKLHLDEFLLDGNALKITGQGSIDLKDATANIIVLAAPLKTVDRVVNKIPIIKYITGGSLISVPLRLHGKVKKLSVVPLPPSAVGKGLLDFMERTLKAPFQLVENAKEAVSEQEKKKE